MKSKYFLLGLVTGLVLPKLLHKSQATKPKPIKNPEVTAQQLVFPADIAYLNRLITKTKVRDFRWYYIQEKDVKENWELGDVINVIQTMKNGEEIRIAQDQHSTRFFLHIMTDENQPVRLVGEDEKMRELLHAIADTSLPNLKRIFKKMGI